jgi:hypothetical protein
MVATPRVAQLKLIHAIQPTEDSRFFMLHILLEILKIFAGKVMEITAIVLAEEHHPQLSVVYLAIIIASMEPLSAAHRDDLTSLTSFTHSKFLWKLLWLLSS